jgi:enamine deaminase RidA (YjgF/YER057c/UK114 family)
VAQSIRFINPNTMAKPPGYSNVVETTGPVRTIYVAGQLGLDLDNRLVGGPGDFRAQCEMAFENLRLALAAVGAGFKDVVKINSYLVDMSHIATFRELRNRSFAAAPPASTTVAVPQLARPGALFEIEAVAVLPGKAAAKHAAKITAKSAAKSAAKRGGKRKVRRRTRR